MATINELREALGEAREHVILNKYNDAMILMAQITIDVVEHLVDDALIVSKGYEQDLKTLLANNIISSDTMHNFETLIISGIKAHEGVNIPKEHAETALQILNNEFENVVSKENKVVSVGNDVAETSHAHLVNNENKNENSPMFSYDDSDEKNEPYVGDFSMDYNSKNEAPAFMGENINFREKEKLRKQILENEKNKGKKNVKKLFAIIIPIVGIILIAILIRSCVSAVSSRRNTPTAPIMTEPPTTETTEETEPETTGVEGYYRVTADVLNLRTQANTSAPIAALVPQGEQVQVTGRYNDDWYIVRYNERMCFAASQYLQRIDTAGVAEPAE